ncbi:hypothetical protein HX001_06375 [Empedobacter brevis]|uniref:Uncharacterized protein n=1 Tax=Empedobacter brevis TaxID=247 RepID=A0AAJ1QDN6_9FLAO|nr:MULTISPECIES: hypothetical protein [Empedobacter]MDM1072120.1 hypothetical protein [Empedobacter brevis]
MNDVIICSECKSLIGKRRYTPPHKYLKESNFKEVKSMFGNVDEYLYECTKCSTKWLFETSSYGEGWIKK